MTISQVERIVLYPYSHIKNRKYIMSLPSPIYELLRKPESKLEKLFSTAIAIQDLNQHFATVLDSDLIPHCRVGYYDSGILTLFTDTAAWATKLRYSVPKLLSQLRSRPHWAGLRSIQIKIQTNWYQLNTPTPSITASPLSSLSDNTVNTILRLAKSLKNELGGQPGSEKLIRSLEKLAASGKSK